MEAENSTPIILSERYYTMKSSFKLAVQSLLTACSREDVNKAFEGFSESEKDKIYRLFLRVIQSLHNSIEVQFDSACEETKVGATLDMVDQIIEERSLDVLPPNSNDFGGMREKITQIKKDEISHLTSMLQEVEKSNNEMRTRMELMRNNQGLPSSKDAVEKLRRWNAEY